MPLGKSRWIWVASLACLLVFAALAGAGQLAPTGGAPAFRNVSEILAAHDRALIRDLAEYLRQNPKAEDFDQAYMVQFSKAIDHDWFAENEANAQRYLEEQPQGGVRSLAQIITTMARAQAGRFDESLASFLTLVRGLDRPDQEEFATNFADTLATAATSAGEHEVARRVYEAVLKQFSQSPTLRQKVRDDLARLDRIGKPAPALAVKDIGGQPLRLDQFKGKYVLVDFWATWCAPCVAELPNLQAVYSKYHPAGFDVVGVSLDESPDALTDFAKSRKIPWRQVHNSTSGADLVEAFGVTTIPATFLVDPEGTIVRLELRGPALEQTVSKLLKVR
ncbi:MAG TPA: TlpA disulfide reductase family protein [Isosphaeraceae bacterium]|nr:TlpA disulfide reductase family protein [Isosphaeraceae bacterium]